MCAGLSCSIVVGGVLQQLKGGWGSLITMGGNTAATKWWVGLRYCHLQHSDGGDSAVTKRWVGLICNWEGILQQLNVGGA